MPRIHSSAAVARAGTAARFRRQAARQAIPMALAVILVWALWDRIAGIDIARVTAAFHGVSAAEWTGAALFTGLSFWAVGRYDAVAHRLLGSAIGPRQATRAGIVAISVAQTVGFGIATGALVRWRMLPGLSLQRALAVSVVVSVSFIAAWALVASVAVLAIPLPLPGGRVLAAAALLSAAALVALSLAQPRPLLLPPLPAMAAFLGLALVDTVAAGAALWVLLPAEIAVAPVPLIGAYIVALGAGLLLSTPGGVGPFEVTLLALLPNHAQEPVLGAVLAFRAVYYAGPALLGAALLIRGPAPALDDAAPAPSLTRPAALPHLPASLDGVVRRAGRAEAQLIRHGRLSVLADAQGRPLAIAAASGQSLIALGDPFAPRSDCLASLDALAHVARSRFRQPCLYKAGGRLAAAARARGWHTIPVAREAWLAPGQWTPDGPARRQLRRKLRKAAKSGVAATPARGELPLDEMRRIARDWARSNGGERGFSMGVYDPDLLGWQNVYLARCNGRLVGFLTTHVNQREEALDLMRQSGDAPDGTMHMLVALALGDARRRGVGRFSLAAVPYGATDRSSRFFAVVGRLLDRGSGGGGLRQFKTAFAPRWETLYFAAPTRLALALAAGDVLREITRPAPARRDRERN